MRSRNGSTRNFLGIATIGLTVLASIALVSAASDDFDIVQAGSVTYRVPKAFRAEGDSKGDLFLQARLSDWGPLERDRPGWTDNVNILIEPLRSPISAVYDSQWDGSPSGKLTKWKQIERTYRIEPEFTVQEMGSSFDIIIPDQDRSTMPLGVLECTRPNPPVFPNASCSLRFDRDGQRWTITFGRQYLQRYGEFRARSTDLIDNFREVKP